VLYFKNSAMESPGAARWHLPWADKTRRAMPFSSAGQAKRITLSVVLWPILMSACLYVTWRGIESGRAGLFLNLAYLGLAGLLFALERMMPHERQWLQNDRQMLPDLAHTLLTKGFSQILILIVVVTGIPEIVAAEGGSLWPNHWPVLPQILLGLLIAEVGLYTAHRVAHTWPLLWRFHAVHHSVTRLWFFNTGRFHLVDALFSILLSQSLLFLAGAPAEIFVWVAAITIYVGLLTHCNVEMRLGPLNFLINTPVLHRWHHSRDPREGDRNFGENLMLFDLLLGTFFCPARRPPVDIGIDGDMPASFGGQLLAPFNGSMLTRARQPSPAA